MYGGSSSLLCRLFAPILSAISLDAREKKYDCRIVHEQVGRWA